MGEMMYVVPVGGLVVRYPENMARLPETGGWVLKDSYWMRRMADGSVREAERPTTSDNTEALTPPIKTKGNREA